MKKPATQTAAPVAAAVEATDDGGLNALDYIEGLKQQLHEAVDEKAKLFALAKKRERERDAARAELATLMAAAG